MDKIYKHIALVVMIFSSHLMQSNEVNQNEAFKANSLKQNIQKDPLKGIKIFYDKKIYINNGSLEINNLQDLRGGLSEPSSDNFLTLDKGEFIQIQGVDSIYRLFDGSIIVKFESIPNLSTFAISKEIELISDLSNINRAVFKVNNLYDLEAKIDELKSDKNIVEIELNLLDPRRKPE